MGRTQEILALLALLMREGKLKRQQIFIGGLGRVFTEIYDLESHRTNRHQPDLQLHEALELTVLEKGQAQSMGLTGGRLFVITAGMMSENTAAHDLALRMMGNERMAIFFVGYADGHTGRAACAPPNRAKPFSFQRPSGAKPRANAKLRNSTLPPTPTARNS